MKWILILLMIFMVSCANENLADSQVDESNNTIVDPSDNIIDKSVGHDMSDSDNLLDFKNMFDAAPNYVAKYHMTTSGEEVQNIDLAYYFMENNIRMDTINEQVSTRVYKVENKAYSCMQAPEWVCYVFEMESDIDPNKDIKNNLETIDVDYTGTKTFAGVSGKCYTINVEDANYEACYSSKGVPLYMKWVSEEFTTEMTVYEVGTPKKIDFDIPATPTQIPTY